jgi:hypothetical protein
MKYDTAMGFFKTGRAIAWILNIKPQAVYQWKKTGVVPIKSALRLQAHSKGKCKVDPRVYERPNGRENARI